MNKEIENIARKICFRSGVWNTCEECLEYHHATRRNYCDYAEAFINAGYHKKECKRQAIKEFADELKIKAIKLTAIESHHICEFVDELLKEYENEQEK